MLNKSQLMAMHNFAHATSTEYLVPELAQEYLKLLLAELRTCGDEYAYDVAAAEKIALDQQSPEVQETITRKVVSRRVQSSFIDKLDGRREL